MTPQIFCGIIKSFDVLPIALQKGVELKCMGPLEKVGFFKIFDAHHFPAEGVQDFDIIEIHKGKQFEQRIGSFFSYNFV